MSYILDALKKAERERDIRQVPTLMAEHEPEDKRRWASWLTITSLTVCVLAAGWTALLLRQHMSPPGPTPSPALTRGTTGVEVETVTPPNSIPATPLETVSPKPESYWTDGGTAPGSFRAARTIEEDRIRQITDWIAATRQPSQDAGNHNSNETPVRQPTQMQAPVRAAKAEAPPTGTPGEKPIALKEAIKDMTLSVLVFDENPTERMVFINGRKYMEGDYVEDLFLLESITLDGAVLRYQGERATLRPKSR